MERRIKMRYITKVVEYQPRAKEMAEELEQIINQVYRQEGGELVTFSITNSAKAILIFKVQE